MASAKKSPPSFSLPNTPLGVFFLNAILKEPVVVLELARIKTTYAISFLSFLLPLEDERPSNGTLAYETILYT